MSGLGEPAKPISDRLHLYLGDRRLACVVCGGDEFRSREVMMNTRGMTYLGWDWANKAALGAVCRDCGYVHTFLDGLVELRDPDA